MAKHPAVTDQRLSEVLGVYAGMVNRVLANPQRWLGLDEDPPPSAALPARALDALRDRAFGEITPASPTWGEQPVQKRVDWWVTRIGISAGLAAATPRFLGALADRVPLQSCLGAAAAGLAVCATAREHGTTTPSEWVPLLAAVLFKRDLTSPSAGVPPTEESERALAIDPDQDTPGTLAKVGAGAQRAAKTLWQLARALLEVQDLLDERPRGSLVSRALGKVPVVGVASGWLDERGGIRKAARRTARLVTEADVSSP